MGKIVLSINVSVDGFADHTVAVAPDDEMHDFFRSLLGETDLALFGRATYELMAHAWPQVEADPSARRGMYDFAVRFNAIPKMVFSKTLDRADWNNTTLSRGDIVEQVLELKRKPGMVVSVGGIRIAQELMRRGLIDEYWLVVHPVVCGSGRRLFDNETARSSLRLLDTRTFRSGAVVLHYQAVGA